MSGSNWLPRVRVAFLLPALLALFAGCTTSPAAASTSSRETASAASKCGGTRVVPVHGRLVSFGGRTVAHIDAFPAREQPSLGGPMELYLRAYPTEEFDAFVTAVTPLDHSTATAEADLARADDRLIPDMPFTAQMVIVTTCSHAHEIRSRRDPFVGDM